MTMNDTKKDIIQRLRKYHSGKWVSPVVAVDGISPEAFAALSELVDDHILERKHIYHNSMGASLVRYVEPHYKPILTIIDGDKE